ncbi:HTH domain-containing protein, partial [Thauera sp.]|uniref:HTH domain-containing protein n=1 Tax=Thauera sp. TaxID=1905334 RepID=UPI003F8F6CE3
MNRAERIFRLHRCLKSRQPPSLARLMDELDASRATINRDIEYMRLHMGAPITYAGQSHLHVITPSSSARNSSIVAASMRLDLMLALRVVLSRSRF